MTLPQLLSSPLLALSDNAWANLAEIVFGTVFSIALIWVIMQIWKKEDDEGKGQSGSKADPKDGEKS